MLTIVSLLHFGQNRGRFSIIVSGMTINLVFFPQLGHKINFLLLVSIKTSQYFNL